MVRFATPKDINELKKMWHDIFKDDMSYIDLFFENAFQCDNTLVFEINENLIAMLYMVDYSLLQDHKTFEIVYLYALATKPEYRGKGIMRELLQEAFELCKKRKKDALMLIPADKKLCKYYENVGFAMQRYIKTVSKEDGYTCNEIMFEDISIINGILLSERQLHFQRELAKLEDLTPCKISNDGSLYQYKLCTKKEITEETFKFDHIIMMKFITDFALRKDSIISMLLI